MLLQKRFDQHRRYSRYINRRRRLARLFSRATLDNRVVHICLGSLVADVQIPDARPVCEYDTAHVSPWRRARRPGAVKSMVPCRCWFCRGPHRVSRTSGACRRRRRGRHNRHGHRPTIGATASSGVELFARRISVSMGTTVELPGLTGGWVWKEVAGCVLSGQHNVSFAKEAACRVCRPGIPTLRQSNL